MIWAVLAILGAVLIGAISPGPSFVIVAKTSVANSRAAGLATALGMGTGAAMFAAAALLGLHSALLTVPTLYRVLKVLGAGYLLYLAVKIWRSALAPLDLETKPKNIDTALNRSFRLGLTTQLSNPKTAVFYASIFSTLLPVGYPRWTPTALVPAVLMIEFAWYAVVAVAFSADRPKRFYLRSKRWVDRLAAGVMATLGLRLLSDARW